MSGHIKFGIVGCGHIGKRHAEMVKRHPEAERPDQRVGHGSALGDGQGVGRGDEPEQQELDRIGLDKI